VTYY